MSFPLQTVIPGRIIQISDKVTLKLWPRLQGEIVTSASGISMKLKPMTVSPYYPLLHPSELEFLIQQVVIRIPPLPKANDDVKDKQDDYQRDDRNNDQDDQEGSVTSYSSEKTGRFPHFALKAKSTLATFNTWRTTITMTTVWCPPSWVSKTGDSAVELGQKGKRED
ncbi:hypothetical protein BDR04DRAFT_1087839 [Suillus decipiens]|nr:hypothetical protein BDR04DRAFT_1087839 [Suillus decipiens]